MFVPPEEAAIRERQRKERVMTPSVAENPTRAMMMDMSKAARERNARRAVDSRKGMPGEEIRVTGFRSLLPVLRRAMVRLHPDAAAGRVGGSGGAAAREAAEESLRSLLRGMAALEILAAEPAGTVAELADSLKRRKDAQPEEGQTLRGEAARGTSLLGPQTVSVTIPADRARSEPVTVTLEVSAGLVAATKRSEEAAIAAAKAGRKPVTAVISAAASDADADGGSAGAGDAGSLAPAGGGDSELLLSPAVVEGAALPAPGVRARWLRAAQRFVTSLATALQLGPSVAPALRMSSPVKRLLAAPLASGTGGGGTVGDMAAERVPGAAAVGLEARRRNRLSPIEQMLQTTDNRPAQSLGKVYPNPRQPLDQMPLTPRERMDEVVQRLTSPDRLSSAFVGDANFAAGTRTLTAVLYTYFEALQLADPFWALARVVIGAGYAWEPRTLTVYLPWSMHSREAGAFLRDLAPTLLARARAASKDDLRAGRLRGDVDKAEAELRTELRRQEHARARRERERSAGRASPWAGEWEGAGSAAEDAADRARRHRAETGSATGGDGDDAEAAEAEAETAAAAAGRHEEEDGFAEAAGHGLEGAGDVDEGEESDADRAAAFAQAAGGGGGAGRGASAGTKGALGDDGEADEGWGQPAPGWGDAASGWGRGEGLSARILSTLAAKQEQASRRKRRRPARGSGEVRHAAQAHEWYRV
ncbi:hypothetical protein FNF31_07129 [Cafeteria roenbergensis]|uniref:Uncharacterized protein n=1 Tax=Cafeteria roenbergensis TaxID=33653 RepID=A0A5A8C9Y2_CAFRO|nr:hypothetical protein FNF31_07129 [Cafeteria roenbergensis]KAA0161541.1 hypothetical protein FNF28_04998 [Cafeteria roenbergensis]